MAISRTYYKRKKRDKKTYNTKPGLDAINKSGKKSEYSSLGGTARFSALSKQEIRDLSMKGAKKSWTKESREKRIQNRIKRKAGKVPIL